MTKQEKQFIKIVRNHYNAHKRNYLPWRKTTDPYHILVSELMLQQTQVDRVVPKYEQFVRKWPTVEKLAGASLGDVLQMWQGLGYNRRAKFLHECAKEVVNMHAGSFPVVHEKLLTLPGVGPYTAGAVMAFAYDKPVVMIETNIRTTFLYHFFQNNLCIIHDTKILELVERTLPSENIREWYAALMDYGACLKRVGKCQNFKSKSYKKQPPFKGSDREIRGAILRTISESDTAVKSQYIPMKLPHFSPKRISRQVEALLQEELLKNTRQGIVLP